ncbi:MAG: M56 family metallopeptidase [Bryobacteraceae bacterium]
MNPAWMTDFFAVTVKVTVLLAVAWVVTLALRRASASTRYIVWASALAGSAALPALALLLPTWRITGVPLSTLTFAASGPAAASRTHWPAFLFAVWCAGAALSLFRLVRSVAAVHALARSAQPAFQASPCGAPLLVSGAITTPMTWGFLHPVILLPAQAVDWPADRHHAVIDHELAHIVRRDWLWRIAAHAVCALYWFHPLVWLAAAALRDESERACDDRVLTGNFKASDYAAHLVEIARAARRGKLAHVAALPMIRPSDLEHRVAHILNGRCNRGHAGFLASAAAIATVALLVVPLAAMQAGSGKAYKIGDGVTAPSVVSKVEPEYTQEAKDAKIQGTVVLYVEIDENGKAAAEKVLRSLDSGLDRNAIDAVRQWKFKPGLRKGNPVRVAARIEVNFRLK